MSTLSRTITLACYAAALRAEVHTMNLRQGVERALQQNPEIAMARLDELKAQEAVRVQQGPFAPHGYFGSGLAYTNGFPMSIDGAAPSVVQGHASQFLFNRQQSYVVARTKEEARGAGIAASAKKDDVAFRTAALFLDAERAARAGEMARKELESSQKVLATVENRVQEGRELPLESKRAALNLARARQIAYSLDADRETAETSLAIVLGYGADDPVHPAAPNPRWPSCWGTARTTACNRLPRSGPLRPCRLPRKPLRKERYSRANSCTVWNLRLRPRDWRAGRPKPRACRAWTWWRSMVCSPPSTTTRIISSNTSATMVRSAFRSCSRSCWGRV